MSKNTIMDTNIKKNICEGCGLFFLKKNEYQSHIKECDFIDFKEDIDVTKKNKKTKVKVNKSTKNKKIIKEKNVSENVSENISKEKVIKTKNSKNNKTEKKIDYSYLRLPENNVVYELKNDDKANEKVKIVLKSIDRAHNILYQAENIVGQKALQIIMNLLFIKLIQPLLSDKDKPGKIDLLNKKYYEDKYDDEDLEQIFEYFKDLKSLTKLKSKDIRNDSTNDAIKQMGEILKRHPITKMIYTEANFIKVREASTIQTLINEVIDKIDFKNFENNEDVIGEIYEHFLTKYVKSDSKELGQFFTPRKLMKLILGYKKTEINKIFSKINKDKEISIYDSCMGTAGWIVTTYNMFCSQYKNLVVAGGEVEPETFQYGLMNICMCLHKFPNDVRCNSSLTHVNSNKHDLITTNPPFNSKKQIKFEQIKSNFENDEYTKENKVKIEEIYNLKKDDPPIQFLELDTWKLNDNGMCIIILPYGEFFSGNSYTKTREYFMKTINITDIILVPGGIFTHTGIKTCVLIYQKDANGTKQITFSKINNECNKIEKITTVLIEDINKESNLSWYHSDYLIDSHIQKLINKMSKYEWVEFDKVFTLEKGKTQSSEIIENDEGKYIILSISEKNKKTNIINENEIINGENIFISTTSSGTSSGPYETKIKYYNGECSYTNLLSRCILNNNYKDKINIKFIYYYLKSIQSYIEKNYEKGTCNKSLDNKNFNRMKIPIPSLNSQNMIIKRLDSSNEKVYHMKKMIEIMKQDIIIFYSWDIEIGNRYEETEWIEFNKVFTLEKGKIQSSKVEENEDGIILLTGAKEENFKKIIKQNESYLNGENIFISQSGNGDKRPIKYFNGECNYSDLMSVMHLNKNYINKINLKYIYYYLKNLQEHIENNYQKGSCNQSLDEKNFNRIKIQIPPIEHQNNSMKTISNIEETIKRWVIDIENILNDGEGKFMIYLEMEMESK
jgi:type I restriction-modification system DNA methylase subunit